MPGYRYFALVPWAKLFLFKVTCLYLITMHIRVIDHLFAQVDQHIEKGTLLTELNLSALPSLYDKFIDLIKKLVCIFILKS